MYFRISILIGIIITLSGCTLPGTRSENDGEKQEGTFLYNGTGFSISLPIGWDTTQERETITPKTGEIILKAISSESKYGFSNNILIMKDTLGTPITSKRYSELNQIQTSKKYLEYTKMSDEAILFVDDDESRITVFEAKYNNNTTRMKFIQTAKVCGTNVYLLHATITIDKNPDNYIKLFKTFSCD